MTKLFKRVMVIIIILLVIFTLGNFTVSFSSLGSENRGFTPTYSNGITMDKSCEEIYFKTPDESLLIKDIAKSKEGDFCISLYRGDSEKKQKFFMVVLWF